MKVLTSKRVQAISVREPEMYSPAVDEIGIFRRDKAAGSDSVSAIGGRVSDVARKAAGLTWKVIRFVNPFSLTAVVALSQSLTIPQVPFREHATREERARREKVDIVRASQLYRPE